MTKQLQRYDTATSLLLGIYRSYVSTVGVKPNCSLPCPPFHTQICYRLINQCLITST